MGKQYSVKENVPRNIQIYSTHENSPRNIPNYNTLYQYQLQAQLNYFQNNLIRTKPQYRDYYSRTHSQKDDTKVERGQLYW